MSVGVHLELHELTDAQLLSTARRYKTRITELEQKNQLKNDELDDKDELIEKLKQESQRLREALKSLVDIKDREDCTGIEIKDEMHLREKAMAWAEAREVLAQNKE